VVAAPLAHFPMHLPALPIGCLQARETYTAFVERMRAAYIPGGQHAVLRLFATKTAGPLCCCQPSLEMNTPCSLPCMPACSCCCCRACA
jgi:hypothetical protein